VIIEGLKVGMGVWERMDVDNTHRELSVVCEVEQVP